MGKELILIFVIIVIFILYILQSKGVNVDAVPTIISANKTETILPARTPKKGKNVKFADQNHERTFNKETGSVIEEKYIQID